MQFSIICKYIYYNTKTIARMSTSSSVKIRNIRGPMTLLSATPLRIPASSDRPVPTLVQRVLPVNSSYSQNSNTPRIPYENNLANNFLWETTSKASLKSMQAIATPCLSCKYNVLSLKDSSKLVQVDPPLVA